jgi:hypothetical protein
VITKHPIIFFTADLRATFAEHLSKFEGNWSFTGKGKLIFKKCTKLNNLNLRFFLWFSRYYSQYNSAVTKSPKIIFTSAFRTIVSLYIPYISRKLEFSRIRKLIFKKCTNLEFFGSQNKAIFTRLPWLWNII